MKGWIILVKKQTAIVVGLMLFVGFCAVVIGIDEIVFLEDGRRIETMGPVDTRNNFLYIELDYNRMLK